jgi:ATP-dependent Clp protease ATP-binding subunit ClpC
MFERYTEKARRVIFFARYEASQFGTSCIETEHLLLGLLREAKELADYLARRNVTEESVRKRAEEQKTERRKIPTSVDMPLSQESKRALAYAAEEAERLSDKHIGTEHLLLGLVREKEGLAAEILREAGCELAKLRQKFGESQSPTSPSVLHAMPPLLAELSTDLTEAASRDELDPLIGRAAEFERMIQILSRNSNNNVALLGEPGVGKQAAIEGLAYCIANGQVPPQLEEVRIVQIVLSPVLAILRETPRVKERLKEVLDGLSDPAKTIYSVEGLFNVSATGNVELARLLRPLLSMGEMQCIGVATSADFKKAAEIEPWLVDSFRVVELPAPNESEAIEIVFAARPRYQNFHGVKYTDEALRQAVILSKRFLPDCHQPDIAIDMIDDAGAACTARPNSLPEDVKKAQQRVKSIAQEMENAISAHEFEKAKNLSEEVGRARAELREILEKHNVDPEDVSTVGKTEIEVAVAQRAGIPVEEIRRAAGPTGAKPESKG